MTQAAILLLMCLPSAEPAEGHDVLLEVGDNPAVRLRLRIELNGQPLTKLDANAKVDCDGLKGKPGASVLTRLLPDGSLLHTESLRSSASHHAVLSKVIFKTLDTNGDGKLSAKELAVAESVLLSQFDRDDDECITALELVPDLQTVVPEKRKSIGAIRATVVPMRGKADLEYTVKLGGVSSYWRGQMGGVSVEFHARMPLPTEKPVLPKTLLAAGRVEVKAAFEKIAPNVISLIAVPDSVGLFDLLDTNRDGQISVAELRQAKTVLANWSPSDNAISIVISQGMAKPPVVPFLRTFTHETGPSWFRAMDRNGDGFVSAREFLGTQTQFGKLDRDGDGLISPEEAEKAAKP